MKIVLKSELFCLLMVCIVSGIISLVLGQPLNWDLANYHYYNGYALLHHRLSYDIAPAQIQTYLNPLMDLFCYLLLSSVRPSVIGFIVGFIQGVNIFLLFKIVRLYYEISDFKDFIIVIAVSFAGYLGAASISEIGTFFGDNIISIFELSSLYFLLKAGAGGVEDNPRKYYFMVFLSSYFAGFGAGLKLTGAIYVVSLVIIFALFFRKKMTTVTAAVFCAGAGFLTTGGFWMKILYERYESPLFPFYNKFFKSPYYQYVNFSDERFMPATIIQKLFYPFYFTTIQSYVGDAPFRDIRLAVCYAAIVLYCSALIINKLLKQKYDLRIDRKREIVIGYCVISYVIWQLTFSIYRYLMPIEMLSIVIVFLLITSISTNKKFISAATLIIIAAMMAFTVPFEWGRVNWHDHYFEVRIDERVLHAKPGSIVLLLDEEPLSYVIPYFPKDFRFVRINSFPNPNEQDRLQEQIREILAKAGSDIFVMTDGAYPETDAILAKYNLKAGDTAAYPVKTNLHDHIIVRNTVSLPNVRN